MQETAGFELLEHTADVGIRAWGDTLETAFEQAAHGLFAVIADPVGVDPRIERRLAVEADDPEGLLVEWLERLNREHQIRGELYASFRVQTAAGGLTATIRGEPLDPARHDLRSEVKAVTWHGVRVRREETRTEVRVLLDI
jgi:SHS2 domain-containing protein